MYDSDMSDYEWRLIKPLLPNKSRGVARVDGLSMGYYTV